METITIILGIVMLVFGILQIILFFKVWGMTDDVSSMKRDLKLLAEIAKFNQKNSAPTQVAPAEIEMRDCDFNIDNKGYVKFADGISGRVKLYPGYSTCAVITKEGYELLYNTRDAAVRALHAYLETGAELKSDLCEKRKINDWEVQQYVIK